MYKGKTKVNLQWQEPRLMTELEDRFRWSKIWKRYSSIKSHPIATSCDLAIFYSFTFLLIVCLCIILTGLRLGSWLVFLMFFLTRGMNELTQFSHFFVLLCILILCLCFTSAGLRLRCCLLSKLLLNKLLQKTEDMLKTEF